MMESTGKAVVLACLVVGLSLGPPLAQASGDDNPEIITGTGKITCRLAPAVFKVGCYLGEEDDSTQYVEVGEISKASFEIRWTPESPLAENLKVSLLGNDSCQEDQGEACDLNISEGPSPLNVSLSGVAAQNTTLAGIVEVPIPCDLPDAIPGDPGGCMFPPVGMTVSQSYEYRWTIWK